MSNQTTASGTGQNQSGNLGGGGGAGGASGGSGAGGGGGGGGSGTAIGKQLATKGQIFLISFILLAMNVLVFAGLIYFWPHPTPSTAGLDALLQDTGKGASSSTDTTRAASNTIRDTAAAARDTAGAARDTSRGPARPADRLVARTPNRNTPADSTSECEKREYALRAAWARDRKYAPAECMTLPWPVGLLPGLDGEFLLWDEVRLLILVLLSGALGSQIFAIRSLGWYVGNRELVRSWLPRYVFLAFTGAGLAFTFYVVIRGGFFSPATTVEATSPFGFVAFGVLMGLFSEQAILKLKEVTETLLAKPEPGKDPKPQNTEPSGGAATRPTIESVTRDIDAAGAATTRFTVKGTNFVAASEVFIGTVKQLSSFVSERELKFTVDPVPAAGTKVTVVVRNPGDLDASHEFTIA